MAHCVFCFSCHPSTSRSFSLCIILCSPEPNRVCVVLYYTGLVQVNAHTPLFSFLMTYDLMEHPSPIIAQVEELGEKLGELPDGTLVVVVVVVVVEH